MPGAGGYGSHHSPPNSHLSGSQQLNPSDHLLAESQLTPGGGGGGDGMSSDEEDDEGSPGDGGSAPVVYPWMKKIHISGLGECTYFGNLIS